MKPSEAQIRRRIEKHRAALLETIKLLHHRRISGPEAHRRNRAADKEYHAIRELMDKSYARSRAKKTAAKTKKPEQAPSTPKGPKTPWMGRKGKGGTTTYRIG
jgi:hypothetical protein